MDFLTALFIYFLIWWLTIFAVLPLGVQRDDSPQAGNDAGAPKNADLKKKIILNTIISAVILAIIWGLTEAGVFSQMELYLKGQ